MRDSWYLQVYVDIAFPREIQRNVDDHRGAAVASCISSRRRSSRVFHLFPDYEVSSSRPRFVGSLLTFSSGCGAVLTIFFSPADPPPAQCRARVQIITPLSEAKDCRFFVFVQIRPADVLPSPEPGGDQDTLFAHNVVHGYVRDCVLTFLFCV